jgi:hypothetical protein
LKESFCAGSLLPYFSRAATQQPPQWPNFDRSAALAHPSSPQFDAQSIVRTLIALVMFFCCFTCLETAEMSSSTLFAAVAAAQRPRPRSPRCVLLRFKAFDSPIQIYYLTTNQLYDP